jgi:hypothetical protein
VGVGGSIIRSTVEGAGSGGGGGASIVIVSIYRAGHFFENMAVHTCTKAGGGDGFLSCSCL